MNTPTCAYCFSTEVDIVSSYPQREVVVVRCRACGKTSELDTENPNTQNLGASPSGGNTQERGGT